MPTAGRRRLAADFPGTEVGGDVTRVGGWVYDRIQKCCGLSYTQSRLAPHVAATEGTHVLDVGGGTGLYRQMFLESVRYLLVDIDPRKLRRFRREYPGAKAVLGDATCLCLADHSIDVGLCVALSHHLSDSQLPSLFRELARVIRHRLVFLDAVDAADSWISRGLWWMDNGAFPRPAGALLDAIAAEFTIEHVEEYRVYHRYVLCVARP